MSGPPHHGLGIVMLKPVTPSRRRYASGVEAIGGIRTSPDL